MARTFIKKHRLFIIAVILFWLKVYIVQRFFFHVPTENVLQEMLLFINPLSAALLIFSISLFFSLKRRRVILLSISMIGSVIVYANLIYNRFFSDFITIPTLFQTKNMGDLGESIFTLIQVTDIFLFFDVLLLFLVIKRVRVSDDAVTKRQMSWLYVGTLALFAFNLVLSEIEHPQLLTKSFDRSMVVQNIGIFNYHLYDLILQTRVSTDKTFAKSDGFQEVDEYVQTLSSNPNRAYTGIAEGKNVFVISLESMQSFVLQHTLDGEPLTPFLNQIIEESYYFSNVYHQTGQGKTSDAEFLVANSLYPLPRGAVFFTNSDNEYNGLPKIVGEEGYYSVVFHSNDETFWNRDQMYDSLGYDRFYSSADFKIREEQTVGWGLKDMEMFTQSLDYLRELPKPFYAKFITLTNHFPYALDEEDAFIKKGNTSSETLNRYFMTVRYTDEALKLFFQQLKAENLYENSIFILYGDHYGISEYHNDALSEYLGKGITLYDTIQLQRVPMIIHIPGQEGKTIETIGGQIDIKPTILNLLGIDNENDVNFGEDLFSLERSNLVALRDGSFVSEDYVYTKQKCFERESGEEIEIEQCEPFIEEVQLQLDVSDRIIYGDLLKFYMK
ncbi:LTA synthase family protein [Pueribacillus sp. YX66]|uniref:LTA synthase family protein n=1 Tax=Pueribacillus sp. YX66 TaxID=3229242 RepID=UPI00358D9F52